MALPKLPPLSSFIPNLSVDIKNSTPILVPKNKNITKNSNTNASINLNNNLNLELPPLPNLSFSSTPFISENKQKTSPILPQQQTISEAPKKVFEFGKTENGLTLPWKLDLSKFDTNKQTSQIPGITKSYNINWWHRALEKVVNTPAEALGLLHTSLVELSNTLLPSPKNIEEVGKMPVITPAQRFSAMGSATLAGANLIPQWQIFNIALQTAQEIPTLSSVAKVIQSGFDYLGKGGAYGSSKLLNVLPLNQQTKNELTPIAENLGGFLTQFLVLHNINKTIPKIGEVKLPGKSVDLTWGDVRDITIGKDVLPEKRAVFDKLTQEGVPFLKGLKEKPVTLKTEGQTVADFIMEHAKKIVSDFKKTGFGLSIENINKLPKEKILTPEEQKIFEKEFVKMVGLIDRTFLGTLEDQYSTFFQLFKNPKINKSPIVKEAITNGDVETLRKELVNRGIMTSEQVDNMVYSQEEDSNKILDKFKQRMLLENPSLMVGKEVAKVLENKEFSIAIQEVKQELEKKDIDSLIQEYEAEISQIENQAQNTQTTQNQIEQQKIDASQYLPSDSDTPEKMPYSVYVRHYLKKPSPSTLSLQRLRTPLKEKSLNLSEKISSAIQVSPSTLQNDLQTTDKISSPESTPIPTKQPEIVVFPHVNHSLINTTYSNNNNSILNKTLPNKNLTVKDKVNALDYIRTPFYVLKKLGLEKEGLLLKQKYDDYLRELPIEINKVTEWSKRAPGDETNQRIFQYLDGRLKTLPENELVIAKEIKAYLKGWAVKLTLPEDSQIAHYITHLFEDELIEKEFDPELAKLITDKVPGSVYDPFLQKRLGALGYKEDVWQALDAYVKRGVRKYNMDVALEPLKKAADKLDLESYKYIEELAARINLRPTKWDTLFDNLIKSSPVGYKLGARPVAKITRAIRQFTYRATLGLNFGSALRNLTQGVNTFSELGGRYTVKGYIELAKSIAIKSDELTKVGVLRDDFIQDRVVNVTKKRLEKMDKVLFFLFEQAERINRGSAYYGAKAKALHQGLNEEQAIANAIKLVEKTQFHFGSVDTPIALQSDITKFFTQFQSFNVKQTEFLAGKFRAKEWAGLLRYIFGSFLMIGLAGNLIGLNWKDMIPFSRVLTGQTKLGETPIIKTIGEILKALFNVPDKYGNTVSAKQKVLNVGDAIGSTLVPAYSQGKKTLAGAVAIKKGGSFTKNGHLQFKQGQSLPKEAQTLLFGKYSSPEAQKYLNKEKVPTIKSTNSHLPKLPSLPKLPKLPSLPKF